MLMMASVNSAEASADEMLALIFGLSVIPLHPAGSGESIGKGASFVNITEALLYRFWWSVIGGQHLCPGVLFAGSHHHCDDRVLGRVSLGSCDLPRGVQFEGSELF